MKNRITTHFFTFLFLISCVFVTQAAKIVFHNNTEKSLTITYDGEDYVLKCDENRRIESTMFRKYMPIVENNIKSLSYKFKIENGDTESRQMESFKRNDKLSINPGRKDTKAAISGAYTRNIYINGYNNVDEKILADGADKISREEDFKRDRLAGTTIDLFPTEKSIRKLSPRGSLACDNEIIAVIERENVAKTAQEKFLDIKFSENEIPLSVAFCGSGGGVRARISTTGFVSGAVKNGLIDCATYFSALSGSSWMLIPWIIRREGMSMKKFKNIVLNDSNSNENFSISTVLIDYLIDKKNNFFYNQPWDMPSAFINTFGNELQKAFLQDIIDKTKNKSNELYLSDIRERVENGSMIIPIFEIRAEKKERGKTIIHEPCFFTPWEFGGRYFGERGACINIKTFGSKFENNEVVADSKLDSRVGPEPDLGLIMGVCGSAFTISTNQNFVAKIAKQNIDPIYILRHSIFDNSVFNCKFNNFMRGDGYFIGYDDKENLFLHDAGIIANLPIISLYRRPENIPNGIKEGCAPDIIFVFDASDTSKGTLGEELLMNKTEMMAKHLAFPNIDEITTIDEKTGNVRRELTQDIITKIKQNGGFYIFDKNPDKKKYKDWEIPTVIYMTLVPGEEYTSTKTKKKFTFDFKNAGTFRFKYDKETCRGLMGLTKNIIKNNDAAIKIAMKKRRVLNRKRALFALKDIKDKPNTKQKDIQTEIKRNGMAKENLNGECKKIQAAIDNLIKEQTSICGVPTKKQRENEIINEIKGKSKELERTTLLKKQETNLLNTNQSVISKLSNPAEMLKIEKEILEEKLKIIEPSSKTLEFMLNFLKNYSNCLELTKFEMLNLKTNKKEAFKLKTPEEFLANISSILIDLESKDYEKNLKELKQFVGKLESTLKEIESDSKNIKSLIREIPELLEATILRPENDEEELEIFQAREKEFEASKKTLEKLKTFLEGTLLFINKTMLEQNNIKLGSELLKLDFPKLKLKSKAFNLKLLKKDLSCKTQVNTILKYFIEKEYNYKKQILEIDKLLHPSDSNILEIEKRMLKEKLRIDELDLPELNSTLGMYTRKAEYPNLLKNSNLILEKTPELKLISFESMVNMTNLISETLHLNTIKSDFELTTEPICSMTELPIKPLEILISQLKFPNKSHSKEFKFLLEPIKSKMNDGLILEINEMTSKRHECKSKINECESKIHKLKIDMHELEAGKHELMLEPFKSELKRLELRPEIEKPRFGLTITELKSKILELETKKANFNAKNPELKLQLCKAEMEKLTPEMEKLTLELKRLIQKIELKSKMLELYKKQPELELEKFELKLKKLKPESKIEIIKLSEQLEKGIYAKAQAKNTLQLIEKKKDNIQKLKDRLVEINGLQNPRPVELRKHKNPPVQNILPEQSYDIDKLMERLKNPTQVELRHHESPSVQSMVLDEFDDLDILTEHLENPRPLELRQHENPLVQNIVLEELDDLDILTEHLENPRPLELRQHENPPVQNIVLEQFDDLDILTEHLENPRPVELRQHENPPVQNMAYGQSYEEIVINEL